MGELYTVQLSTNAWKVPITSFNISVSTKQQSELLQTGCFDTGGNFKALKGNRGAMVGGCAYRRIRLRDTEREYVFLLGEKTNLGMSVEVDGVEQIVEASSQSSGQV